MQVFYKFAKAVWFDQLHWQTWNFWCTTVDTISVESLHFSNTSGCKAHCRCRGGIVWTWDPVLAILRCEILLNICHRKCYEIRTIHVSGLNTLKDDGKNHGRTKFLSANLGVQNVAHRRLMIAWYGDGDVVTCTDQKYISDRVDRHYESLSTWRDRISSLHWFCCLLLFALPKVDIAILPRVTICQKTWGYMRQQTREIPCLFRMVSLA